MKEEEDFIDGAEWSEEDEKMLDSIIKDFGLAHKSTIGQKQWLKSLRPQNNWKPTVEQMNGISTVLARYKMSPQLTKVIESLYFDLKKHYTKKT